MDFSTDCTSYRDMQAAEDFSLAVQSQIASKPSFSWVERAQIKAAEGELQLSLYGLAGKDTALRSGKWAKADWSVFGDFIVQEGQRRLNLQVVNLNTAEILGTRTVELTGTSQDLLRTTLKDVPKVVQGIEEMLSDAQALIAKRKGKKSVALLALLDSSPLRSKTTFNAEFERAFPFEGDARGHYLTHLLGADNARDEASLALSGLVELDQDLWQKVADHYVWGNYDIREQTHVTEHNGDLKVLGRWYVLSPRLHVWNGRTPPVLFTNTILFTNTVASGHPESEAMAGLARELARGIIPLLQSSSQLSFDPNLRKEMADLLLQEGRNLERRMGNRDILLHDSEALSAMVRILEAACFFDPANPVAQEQRIMCRWPDEGLYSGRPQFPYASRQSQAWKVFYDLYGPGFLKRQANSNVVSHYLLSAVLPAKILASSSYTQSREGIPLDMNREIVEQWGREMGAALVQRVISLADLPEMNELSGRLLYPCFQVLERPEIFKDPKVRLKMAQSLWPVVTKGKSDLSSISRDILEIIRNLYKQCGMAGQEAVLFQPLDKPPPAQTIALPRLNASPAASVLKTNLETGPIIQVTQPMSGTSSSNR